MFPWPIIIPPGFQPSKKTCYNGALTNKTQNFCAAAILAVLCITAWVKRQQLKEELSHKPTPVQTDTDLSAFAL